MLTDTVPQEASTEPPPDSLADEIAAQPPEVRPGVVDEIRGVIRHFRTPGRIPFVDAVLRGLGQVVFQNSALSGLLIILALCINSFIYAGMAIFGTAIATGTAMLLRADRDAIEDGLFGFNGALTAIAIVAFASKDAVFGDLPGGTLLLYVALASAFTSVLVRAFSALFRSQRLPGFFLPYCLTALLFVGGLQVFSTASVTHTAHPLIPLLHDARSYSLETWFYGTANGIAEIFFQDNWLTGVVVLAAIAIGSRIAAGAVLIGSAIGLGTGMLLGASEPLIRAGLLGYNSALTAAAMGGFFVLMNRAGALYAAAAAVVTACAWAGFVAFLTPAGLPVLVLPYVLVTWLMLLAARDFPLLTTIAPSRAMSAEDNLRRVATISKPSAAAA